ncbi:YwpF-like family protein [Bacillaceae bacterium S4-13-58]
MKTFKLVSLDIIDEKEEEIVQTPLELIDGLIVNREDEQNHWVVEAFLSKDYLPLFSSYIEDDENVMLQAVITKKSNRPAMVLAKVIEYNEIGDHINVLFIGTLIDRKQDQVEKMLKRLIDEGYQGDELFEKFKELTAYSS